MRAWKSLLWINTKNNKLTNKLLKYAVFRKSERILRQNFNCRKMRKFDQKLLSAQNVRRQTMKIASRSLTCLGSLTKRSPALSSFQTRRSYSTPAPARRPVDLFINDMNVSVPEGTTIIQACDSAGIFIPRFCYHEELSIAGNCRMCLVEVAKSMKPIASCAMPVSPGMANLLMLLTYNTKNIIILMHSTTPTYDSHEKYHFPLHPW
jgi:hypothetical protein